MMRSTASNAPVGCRIASTIVMIVKFTITIMPQPSFYSVCFGSFRAAPTFWQV